MTDLTKKLQRLLDVSKAHDSRFKGCGFRVNQDNRGRGSAELCEWVITANTDYGGTNPYPYGFYSLNGEPTEIQNLPAELNGVPFLEIVPCDRTDRRAVKLTWNEAGTEAEFSFAALAAMLGIDPPKGASLWFDAIPLRDTDGKPVLVIPLGDRIHREVVQETAATKADSTAKPSAGSNQGTGD